METSEFLDAYLPALQALFGDRIWFCGLQGSRARDENTPDSDVDMVVILDTLSAADIFAYRDMISGLAASRLACGFLSGRKEFLAWEPSDLVSLYFDTTPIIGSLEDIAALLGPEYARQAAWVGACGIYHGCVHNMVYDHQLRILKSLLKNVVFVIKAQIYAETGVYWRTLADLRKHVEDREKEILDLHIHMREGHPSDPDAVSAALFRWAQTAIMELAEEGPQAADGCRNI